jgi:4-amino-4-deoxy-L-arabinose transferase-like glycosyltransferase
MPGPVIIPVIIQFIVLSLVIAFLAYRQRLMSPLFLIFCLAFLLRYYASLDPFLHPWDERYHALVAKNLIDNPFVPLLYSKALLSYDYTDWTANHVWLHKPPLALWLISISLYIFGISELSVRLPSILLSSLSVYLTFAIGRQISGRKLGLLAAYIHAIDGVSILLASGRMRTDHVDTLFIVFFQLAVYFAFRSRLSLSMFNSIGFVISTSLAILTKWLVALFVFPVWLVLLISKVGIRKLVLYLIVLSLLVSLIVLPWQVYTFSHFPDEAKWESYYNYIHLFKAVEGHEGDVFYHFHNLWKYYGRGVLLSIGLFFVLLFRSPISSPLWGVAAWFLLPYFVFSLVATKMPAYVMISSGAIFLMSGYAWLYIWNRFSNKYFSFVLLFVLGFLTLRETWYAVHVQDGYSEGMASARAVSSLRERSLVFDSSIVVFGFDYPIEAMFHTDMVVYARYPEVSEVLRLVSMNYRVLVIDNGEMPQYLGDLDMIEIIANFDS